MAAVPSCCDAASHRQTGGMQVKELADLAGTTVRAVRHYHHTGLLPVPEVRDGRRDYDLRHVARLIRIRWLAQAGVSLPRIAGLLGSEPDGARPGAVVADLQATLGMLDEQLERLHDQREQLVRLLAMSEAEGHLSPMPAAVARFYAGLESKADDEATRRAIRHERDFMELAYYRGDIPPEAAAVYEVYDETRRTESLAAFDLMAHPPGGAALTEEEVRDAGGTAVERARRYLGPEFDVLVRSVDPELARRMAELYLRVGAVGDGRRERAVVEAWLAAVEEARR